MTANFQTNVDSISTQIKLKISSRILICLVLSFLMVVVVSFYDFSNALSALQSKLSFISSDLQSYIISQELIGNEQAINPKLETYSNANQIKIEWKKIPAEDSKQNRIFFVSFFKWAYIHNLVSVDGRNFGQVVMTGSFFHDKTVLTEITKRFLFLLFFVFILFILLMPLSNKIPKEMFFEPILGLLSLLESSTNIQKSSKPKSLEIQKIEKQILSLIEKIKEVSKNAALGEMSAQVAHDIRSPLAALNAIVKQTQDIPEKPRIMIRNAAKQINDIANNLLEQYRTDINKKNIPAPEMISILLDTVVSEKRVQPQNSQINIEFNTAPDSYGVFADIIAVDFKRVISNLINNAVESIKNKGKINIHLSHTPENIEITVADTGSGMPQELINKVMKGDAVTSKREGHGIGLASSRRFIQSWGGDLIISSEINKGTVIHITLPLISPADWFASELNFTQNSTVIILDDDQSIHDVWQSRIDTEIPEGNLKLIHFYKPEDLLNADLERSESIKYLCDYELLGHKLSGLDVIEELNFNIQAILVTSRYDDSVIRERCQKIGVKILPKNYAAYVPLVVEKSPPSLYSSGVFQKGGKLKPDLILIDDNKLLTDTWKISAAFSDKKIIVFNDIEQVNNGIDQFDFDSLIYIDSELGNNIKGEDYAKLLYEKGYNNIYLTTGYEASKFDLNKLYWIKKIVGKDIP